MIRFSMIGLLLSVALFSGWPSSGARGELKIDITRGNIDPVALAITEFSGRDPEEVRIGRDITQVMRADLQGSGLFDPIDPERFIETSLTISVRPHFSDWRLIEAQALVQGAVSLEENGRLKVEFRLWDVLSEQQMAGQEFFTVKRNWRRVAHIIADTIYQRMTGESGYFDSRIVYISESGSPKDRIKRLAIMDQDGANHRFLTNGSYLVLTPRFSPTAQEITYLSYIDQQPRVYILDIDTGEQEVLGDFPGMTFAPRFSPDGDEVIMSLSTDGNSEIYRMDIRTRKVTRLTDNPAIDTSPSFSPDGKKVVFESDRSGGQQIYVMTAEGKGTQRISFGKGRYATPVWSPRGDFIAFTKQSGGRFYIGVMRPDGSGERLLAENFLVEGPSWSPNGRVLIFYSKEPTDAQGNGGETRLHKIDLTGYNQQEIITPLEASDPAWSPLIP